MDNNIEYSVCYFYNPVSNDCICLGVLSNSKTTGKAKFVHIKNINRLNAFNDEIDCNSVKYYLERLETEVEKDSISPFFMERYMQSPFAEISFSEIINIRLDEHDGYFDNYMTKMYLEGDLAESGLEIIESW